MGSLIKIIFSLATTIGGIGVIFLALAVVGIFGVAGGVFINNILPGWGDELLSWGRISLTILVVGGAVAVIIGLYSLFSGD